MRKFHKGTVFEKLERVIKHKIRTHSDVVYKQVDIVFYKRANNTAWKGPDTVVGTDGQQILIKYGSFYLRLHSCNLQLKGTFSNDISA